MKSFVMDLYVVFIFVIIARLAESFKVYIIDKNGQVSQLKENTDASKYTAKIVKDKIVLHLDNTLRKSKNKKHTKRSRKNRKKNKKDHRGKNSPVIFTNGRYVLDLDKIEVIDDQFVTNKPENEKDYFDPAESFRDYYEFMNINDKLRSPTDDEVTTNYKSKKKRSRRKFSQILFANKGGLRNRYRKPRKPKHDIFENKRNRFKIINNRHGRERKRDAILSATIWESALKSLKTSNLKSESEKEFSEDPIDTDSRITEEQQSESSEDKSPESAANFYLQGNQFLDLMKLKNKKKNVKRDSETEEKDSETDSETDSSDSSDNNNNYSDKDNSIYRRRLPTFMPKRFHWDVEDIKRLGYFWFNGNRGRYPSPISVS